ncbi:transcriptional regulator with XRE-family HTH domain [Leifsonia shinshuensis]|uniref:Transcriptional regulator with XRE-family HTH domain n=2 Tax=Leifsonia shinshuensis TaxID=150026 RepID=A0A853CWA4_9MICO|nr:transcriptional regulator with XRE-family HTH domain [Leifsonia shinshuensis]
MMVQRRSVQQERMLREFGAHIRRWRSVNGLSATALAERAFITRATLASIERGTGSAQLDSVFAVLSALGILESVVASADPYRSEAARPRIDAIIQSGGTI